MKQISLYVLISLMIFSNLNCNYSKKAFKGNRYVKFFILDETGNPLETSCVVYKGFQKETINPIVGGPFQIQMKSVTTLRFQAYKQDTFYSITMKFTALAEKTDKIIVYLSPKNLNNSIRVTPSFGVGLAYEPLFFLSPTVETLDPCLNSKRVFGLFKGRNGAVNPAAVVQNANNNFSQQESYRPNRQGDYLGMYAGCFSRTTSGNLTLKYIWNLINTTIITLIDEEDSDVRIDVMMEDN